MRGQLGSDLFDTFWGRQLGAEVRKCSVSCPVFGYYTARLEATGKLHHLHQSGTFLD
jgi:hypothetical protein